MHVFIVLRMKDPSLKMSTIRFHVVMGLAELALSLDPPIPRNTYLMGDDENKENVFEVSNCCDIRQLICFIFLGCFVQRWAVTCTE